MESDNDLIRWLVIWISAIVLLILIRWRRKVAGSGLVFAYLLSLSLIHWFGALIYVFPWYEYSWNALWYPGFNSNWVIEGFRLAAYGVVSFIVGSLLPAIFFSLRRPSFSVKEKVGYAADPRLPKAYVITGFTLYFLLTPILGGTPTLTVILSSGLSLMVVGVGLGMWKAWQSKDRRAFRRWLFCGITGFPFLTLMGQGFMSFGTSALLSVVAFVISFYRPRWRVVVLGILFMYLGLSLYVTYMRDRKDIREVIWGGQSMVNRIGQLCQSISTLEWFNPYDQTHLMRIDSRLNQNLLVGAAIEQLATSQDYAKGETILQSVLALIPRVIWLDKPLTAGGNWLVSRYTGLTFGESTSVGIGQVMEFYVNFGVTGVIAGFLCLGFIVAVFDEFARVHLLRGDWQGFTFWLLPGLSLTHVEGSFVEITASVGGAMVTAFLVNKWLHRFKSRRFLKLSS